MRKIANSLLGFISTPYSMNSLFGEFFKEFGGVFLDVFETISGSSGGVVPHPSVWGCQILRKDPLLSSSSLLLVSQNVNTNANKNVKRNVNTNVNKNVNTNVNKNVNTNVNRNVSREPNFRYTTILLKKMKENDKKCQPRTQFQVHNDTSEENEEK